MAEFAFIDWIRRRVVDRPPVLLGIGDDAAVLESSDRPLLVTTDMLMEGTDFTFPETSPELAGRKSLAVNLSDIAAMAGTPTAAFVSVALPQQRGSAFAEAFFTGLLDLADEYGVILAGGDTNTWNGPLVANITLLGYPVGKAAVTRAGAKPGDKIFVTGELGGSILGHHLTFTPRIQAARELSDLVDLHAMIDISDGLAADLHHILQASGVGAVIEAKQLPVRSAAMQMPDGQSPLQHALSDGEDFELLFTVSPADAVTLQREWSGPTRLTCIGEITADRQCFLRGEQGILQPLPALGWQHRL